MQWDDHESVPGPAEDPFAAPMTNGLAGIVFPMDDVARKPLQVTMS